MKIILLRHGESEWNLSNRFTGWTDVDLTSNGVEEAKFSANQIISHNIKVDTVYTSLLNRAIQTSHIVSKIIGFKKEEIEIDWRLNERHYGALQGLNKSETAAKYGESQVHIWRRSYDIPPPLLSADDERHPINIKKFKKNVLNLPTGESLKDVIERLNPFWIKYYEMAKNNFGNNLIVAHSNSLRAIIKILDNLSEKEIVEVNIPTGVPLVYSFDESFNIINKEFLIDRDLLKHKQKQITNQGKAK